MVTRTRPWDSWTTRLSAIALIPTTLVLLLAGVTSAAESQEPSLPGSSADATDPPLQENQVGDAVVALAGGGPSTPILDDFNRQDEYPLSQGGAWSPRDPIGGTQLLAVRALQAAPPVQNTGNNISYRSLPARSADPAARCGTRRNSRARAS